MACVLFVFVIPVVLGYSWNALACGYNALDPAEGAPAHLFDTRVTVECWGASVVSVPDHIKTRLYLKSGEAPLWNPYQGLGEPFAAMGEGSPYFPPAMIRSLAPYSWENGFLVAEIFAAQCFLFYFLRLGGLSRTGAAFGGAAFALSGAVGFHLARANILDQICMIPVLFWAVGYALSRQAISSYVLLAAITALHVAGGFIQVAMTTQVLVLAFAVTMVRFHAEQRAERLRVLSLVVVSTMVGLGLSAFYVLPLLDWLTSGFGKDVPLLSFLTLPLANTIAFFFPLLYGSWFNPAWMPAVPGAYSSPTWAPNWDNLYAVSGTGLLLISAAAAWGTRWSTSRAKSLYLFFLIAGGFLILRYANVAPVSPINWLPIIGRQSPKHANALTAFCVIVAASVVVDHVRSLDLRKATLVCGGVLAYVVSITAGMFGTYLYSLYETGASSPTGATKAFLVYGGLTTLVTVAAFLSLRTAIRWSGSTAMAGVLLSGVVCAESFLYIPVGRAPLPTIGYQFLIAAAIFAAVYALAWSRWMIAASLLGAAAVGYVFLLSAPWSGGLPRAYDLAKPPAFMQWLAANEGSYRSFGIFPDYSVAAKLEDISVVGPLAPPAFKDFVWLISNDRAYNEYVHTGHFMLAGPWHYEADNYARAKPILDWLGVKYLIVDPGKMPAPEQDRFRSFPGLSEAYHDERVTVLGSSEARAKAEYWPCVLVGENQKTILDNVKRDPTLVLGVPSIEKVDERSLTPADQACASATPQDIRVDSYGLDRVKLSLPKDARGGIVVLKDIYAPGWHAEIDGRTTRVVRVNGFIRGVLVPTDGGGSLALSYRPRAFVAGLFVTTLSLIFIIGLLLLDRRGLATTDALPRVVTVAGIAIAVLTLEAVAETYFQVSGPVIGLADSLLSGPWRQ